jgi:hypothetical protein
MRGTDPSASIDSTGKNNLFDSTNERPSTTNLRGTEVPIP